MMVNEARYFGNEGVDRTNAKLPLENSTNLEKSSCRGSVSAGHHDASD